MTKEQILKNCVENATADDSFHDIAYAAMDRYTAHLTAEIERLREWMSVEEPPEHGVEVLGYADEWIDQDYNPKGIRLCFQNDGTWISTYWNNTHDCYEIDSITKPTKWKSI